jgi:hypothetical protein
MDNMQVLPESEIIGAKDGIAFAQALAPKIVYSIKNDAIAVAGSERVAYRRLNSLVSLGLATFNNGQFQINRGAIMQPLYILEKLVPSLTALKHARRFGKSYNDSDIRFCRNVLGNSFTTLDFKAWDLTKFQTPLDLYVYVDDVDGTSSFLKENGFREGKKGHIVLLPKIGDFTNEVQRTYLDSIAKGGRSINDAIAIELLYADKLDIKGQFPIEYVIKVQQDLPQDALNLEATSS